MDDPLAGLDEPPDPAEIAPMPAVAHPAGAPPSRGCMFLAEAPVRVWAGWARPVIAVQGQRFLVAGYGQTPRGEQMFVVEARPNGRPMPVGTSPVAPPSRTQRLAAPGLLAHGNPMVAAMIDGRGGVHVAYVDRPFGSWQPVGEGADRRFAPAIAQHGHTFSVAWTDGRGTPMRVRVATLDGQLRVTARYDVTPETLGASAQVFASGATTPELFFVDARAGVSSIMSVVLGPGGAPRAAVVARAVGSVATPPAIAVARAGDHAFAAYTVLGNGATTAIGLVALDGGRSPATPLVRGTGYGLLHVSAVGGSRRLVFAADAPQAAPADSPREVHLHVVDAGGPGPSLIVRGLDGSASHVAMARRADGVIGVAFVSAGAVWLRWVRCDDSGSGS